MPCVTNFGSVVGMEHTRTITELAHPDGLTETEKNINIDDQVELDRGDINESVALIVDSVLTHGYDRTKPIVCYRRYVIDGHHRLAAIRWINRHHGTDMWVPVIDIAEAYGVEAAEWRGETWKDAARQLTDDQIAETGMDSEVLL